MDTGIRGRKALVCAASKGLGRACARALAREGVSLTICARGAAALETAAAEIRAESGVEVLTVVADLSTAEGRAAVLATCPDPDIVINNNGGPPTGDFRKFTREDWLHALDMNMLTPIELIKATIDGMVARRFGRIVNITSGAVKAPMPQFDLSNGARAGLTGFIGGLARQVAQHNVTLNNLLPGLFNTDRMANAFPTIAKSRGISTEQVIAERLQNIPAGRLGDTAEFGDACAFLCSAQAGYITGQNLLLDGGAYRGLL